MPWVAIIADGRHRVAFVVKGGTISAVKAEHYESEAEAREAAATFNTGKKVEHA
jgi:hypothetical protein